MGTKSDLISVIVPVYKVESYLNRCVQSIVEQSYKELEIILVDDGYPDQCSVMCDSWAEKDTRIHVIHKKNGGLSEARNAGIAAATGDYIAFVDSDDWIAPEMLDRLYTAMRQNNGDISACTVEMDWEDDRPARLLTVQANCVLEKADAQRALLQETLLKQPVWYKLYKRETVQGLLFEVGKYHEDVFWSYQAIGNANRVIVIDYIGYYYMQRSDSIMGSEYSMKRLDAVEAYERRYQYLAEYFPELEKEARIRMISSCIYHGQMALKYLPKKDRISCLRYLNEVKTRYELKHREYADLKVSHRIWLDLARISLKGVCMLKNLVGAGS